MSTPNLDECPSPDLVSPHVFESLQSYQQQWVASVGNCAQFWSSRGVKLASYNNREAADDIEALRQALHYERLRLLGWSAGTDLGISFLRRHGDVVERAVFAATGSEELRPGRPLVDDLELDKIALWYKAARGADAPDLGKLFDQDVKALDDRNVILDLADRKDGPKVQVKIGSVLLKSLVMEMLNGTDGALLPALLTSIHERDYSLLQILAQKAFSSFRSSMTLIGRTVDCSFALPAEGVARAEAEGRESRFGNIRNIYLHPSVCEAALGQTATAEQVREEPLFSRVPTLFISGTMDANTPPFDAETLRWGFPEGAHVIVKNGFHETLTEPPVQDLVGDFFLGRDVSGRSIVFDWTTFLSLEDARTAASHSH
jgi:pimeloyl-ACP methyl ester carboxylesterase